MRAHRRKHDRSEAEVACVPAHRRSRRGEHFIGGKQPALNALCDCHAGERCPGDSLDSGFFGVGARDFIP
jgi:hypothetical protein